MPQWLDETSSILTLAQMNNKLVDEIGPRKASIFTVQFQDLDIAAIASADLQKAYDFHQKAEKLM